MKSLALFVILLTALASSAQAACAALPTGSISALRLGGASGDTGVYGPGSTNHPAGTLAWDSTQGKPVYCDGTDWLVLASGGGGETRRVYDGNGTDLGQYLGVGYVDAATNRIYYRNSANNISSVQASASSGLQRVYFTGTDCSGTATMLLSEGNSIGVGCTGAAVCFTSPMKAGSTGGSFVMNSFRDPYQGYCQSGTYNLSGSHNPRVAVAASVPYATSPTCVGLIGGAPSARACEVR